MASSASTSALRHAVSRTAVLLVPMLFTACNTSGFKCGEQNEEAECVVTKPVEAVQEIAIKAVVRRTHNTGRVSPSGFMTCRDDWVVFLSFTEADGESTYPSVWVSKKDLSTTFVPAE
jgi:hypothetical protein